MDTSHDTIRRAALACALAAVCCASSAIAQAADPKRDVMAAVDGAIRLIEAKQFVELFKTYFRPAEVEELVAKFDSLDELATQFTRTLRHLSLLAVLQAAKESEPAFERDGTIARFLFDPPIGRERGLTLQKVGDRWYLAD